MWLAMPLRQTILVFLAFLIIIGGSVWYIRMYVPQKQSMEYQTKYADAMESHHSGDYDASITGFNSALEAAPGKSYAVQTKFKLAFDLYARNRGDDRTTAVQMYKDIISDTSVQGFQRAIAISDLMDIWNGSHDNQFAKDVIFSGQPLGSFLENDDVELAVRKSYEMADALSPLSLVAFRVAGWYSGQLRDADVRSPEKEAFISELKRWTEKGESLIPSALRLGYEKSKIGYIYQMQGLSRRTIAQFTDGNDVPAEAAFKRGLDVLAEDENDMHSYNVGLYLRFHYAAMLAEVYGDARKSDIEELLAPMVAPPLQFRNYNLSFYEFLKNEQEGSHDMHGHKGDIILLSKMSPAFDSFLSERGLKF